MPTVTSVEPFFRDIRQRIKQFLNPLVLVGEPYLGAISVLDGLDADVEPLDGFVRETREHVWEKPLLSLRDPAILQMTSGTTGQSKTVQVSHGNLSANIQAMQGRLPHGNGHSRMLSWLPLSHDMGLVGGLAARAACGDCDLLLMSPTEYLADPPSWLRLAASHRVTQIVAPSSAYAVAARFLAAGPRLDLSCIDVALCGGESIDPVTVERFLRVAEPHGFDRRSFVPAYGMAEATLAVTMSPRGEGMSVDTVDNEILASRGEAVRADSTERPTRALARLGRPVPGMQVRVVDEGTLQLCADRKVGEVHITGTSLADGYLNDPDPASSRTPDGWLRTGDLGYLVNGELVICGRSKDLIVIFGKNIYPEEVERAVSEVPGVRPGSTVAFQIPRAGGSGTEGLGVGVESRVEDVESLRSAVAVKVRATVGVNPTVVAVLPPGTVPKTPSGKLQRGEAARRFAL